MLMLPRRATLSRAEPAVQRTAVARRKHKMYPKKTRRRHAALCHYAASRHRQAKMIPSTQATALLLLPRQCVHMNRPSCLALPHSYAEVSDVAKNEIENPCAKDDVMDVMEEGNGRS